MKASIGADEGKQPNNVPWHPDETQQLMYISWGDKVPSNYCVNYSCEFEHPQSGKYKNRLH